MKIWIDTSALPHTGEQSLIEAQHLPTSALQQAVSLHVQACGEDRWLICNPTETGYIAVVDTEVLHTLEQFRLPKTVEEAAQDKHRTTYSFPLKALALLYHLKFLQDLSQPTSHLALESPKFLAAWLHITNACNLRCHYCYLDKTSEHMEDKLLLRSVDAIMRSATKHSYRGILLKYAGGEASLLLRHILAAHDYAVEQTKKHALGLSAYIMSNGVVLSQHAIDEFLARKIGVMISLDGIGDYHDKQRPFANGKGSFNYVDRTITRLLANGLTPHINVTVSERNLDGLVSLIEYILEREMPFTLSYYRDNDCSMHLHDLQFSETHMIAKMREVFAYIEHHLPEWWFIGSLIDKANMNRLHHYTCGVGQHYLVIDQHGGIAKCHGDIKQIVTTIEADDPLQIIRNERNGLQGTSVEEKEGCRNCEWRYWCTGGCPLLTYRITGRSDIKSPNCNIYKSLFPEALRLEALRLIKYKAPIIL